MANSTVYPYGTGGIMPADIGIVNDLVTGGANNALSAQQGVVLKNEYGFSRGAKTALLQLIRKIAYIDVDGESLYQQLYAELFPNASQREALFGAFSDGYALSKITSSGSHYLKTYRSAVAARATTLIPFENNGYVFTVTDPSKYNLAAYDIVNVDPVSAPPSVGAVDAYAYIGGTKAIEWKAQDSVSTNYVWLALKKIDGTAFTAEELADGAAAVFNYTQNT